MAQMNLQDDKELVIAALVLAVSVLILLGIAAVAVAKILGGGV